ncbi:uncharacterized protein LOC111694168 [Trichogramma pretiosum]|uniref:uncharacterized protein LOC111694168 n=1 Tax=Trichogramma pretiosum TaxID=7493 RepID=UPI000C71BE30|nr:uncharacterized protein LOC111694168 [Trichogramma pretiosum]
MPKGIASRILDTPRKYQDLISYSKKMNLNIEGISAAQFRGIHRHLFREPTTTAEVVQLRSFIRSHQKEIHSHISSKNEIVLMRQQKEAIKEVFRIMDAIRSKKLCKKAFHTSLLLDIYSKVWTDKPKKRRLAKIKKLLQSYFKAQENGDADFQPTICIGFVLVKDELHFQNDSVLGLDVDENITDFE